MTSDVPTGMRLCVGLGAMLLAGFAPAAAPKVIPSLQEVQADQQPWPPVPVCRREAVLRFVSLEIAARRLYGRIWSETAVEAPSGRADEVFCVVYFQVVRYGEVAQMLPRGMRPLPVTEWLPVQYSVTLLRHGLRVVVAPEPAALQLH